MGSIGAISYERIPLRDFKEKLSIYTELSSVALRATVCSVSDEFFAEASHLLKVEPAPNLKGQFGPNGALYSGWETRRHNPTFDWCIIKLGAPGSIQGFDIDTSHFNGNEAPEVSIRALFSTAESAPAASDPAASIFGSSNPLRWLRYFPEKWKEILPKVSLGPDSRHLFKVFSPAAYNYVKLNIYPDGGVARFRVYGLVNPIFPSDPNETFDLAHVFSGGRVVSISDQHFGAGSNLLLPGRGKHMGDGWETKRSRAIAHKDWAIIKLGQAGILEQVEIDTNHFKGNYPESCELHAIKSDQDVPIAPENAWTLILSRTKLGPHRRHFLQLENVVDNSFTHVRVTIHPDGGIKRVRVQGHRSVQAPESHASIDDKAISSILQKDVEQQNFHEIMQSYRRRLLIPVLPLTSEAFASFGRVLMAWNDPTAAPRGIKVTSANQGTAYKFHKLSLVESSYPENMNASTGFSVYRSTPAGAEPGGEWEVKLLERHPCTNQAFIPMGSASGLTDDELPEAGRAYLVVVALSGGDGKPDLKTLRAFLASNTQGVVYGTGVWHQPMTTLGKAIDFTCVETQVGGDKLDCEIFELDRKDDLPVLKIPQLCVTTRDRHIS